MIKINTKCDVFCLIWSLLFLISSQHVSAQNKDHNPGDRVIEANNQDAKTDTEHNHATMNSNVKKMDHGAMQMQEGKPPADADDGNSQSQHNHDSMNSNDTKMDHGDMQMHGNKPPEDARDPHAYANGTTLTTGPYSMPKENRLKLADEHKFWAVLGDRLEFDDSNNAISYDFQGWYGTTYDRLVIKTEGEVISGNFEENQTDLLWGHAISPFWDTQVGVRLDSYTEGKNRQWLAFGVQGLAPYWFELDITAYAGDRGNTALTIEAEYELLITQKLIFQPRAELTLYGRDDLENNLGSGFSSSNLGFRLRYEFSRQFAPYIGVEWSNKFGKTADFFMLENNNSRDTKILAGLRFWF